MAFIQNKNVLFVCLSSAMQSKLTVQEENINEMTEKIEVLSEELTKVLCGIYFDQTVQSIMLTICSRQYMLSVIHFLCSSSKSGYLWSSV